MEKVKVVPGKGPCCAVCGAMLESGKDLLGTYYWHTAANGCLLGQTYQPVRDFEIFPVILKKRRR